MMLGENMGMFCSTRFSRVIYLRPDTWGCVCTSLEQDFSCAFEEMRAPKDISEIFSGYIGGEHVYTVY